MRVVSRLVVFLELMLRMLMGNERVLLGLGVLLVLFEEFLVLLLSVVIEVMLMYGLELMMRV